MKELVSKKTHGSDLDVLFDRQEIHIVFEDIHEATLLLKLDRTPFTTCVGNNNLEPSKT